MYEEARARLLALGYSAEDAHEEACREVRLTTGDPYFGRSEEELAEMDREAAEAYGALRESAGACEEFPAGEFAVPGFNC